MIRMSLRNHLPYSPRTVALSLILAAMGGTIVGCNKTIDAGTPADRPTIAAVPATVAVPKILARDVKLTACRLGDFGMVNVALTITNHGTNASSYTVSGELLDKAGDRVGEFASVTISPLLPGRVAKLTAAGFVDGDNVDKITCKLTSAQRY